MKQHIDEKLFYGLEPVYLMDYFFHTVHSKQKNEFSRIQGVAYLLYSSGYFYISVRNKQARDQPLQPHSPSPGEWNRPYCRHPSIPDNKPQT